MVAMHENIEPAAETPAQDLRPTALRISEGSTAQAMQYRITSSHSEFRITHSMGDGLPASNVTVQIGHGRSTTATSVMHDILLGEDAIQTDQPPPMGPALVLIHTLMEKDWTLYSAETTLIQTVAVRVGGVDICGSNSLNVDEAL